MAFRIVCGVAVLLRPSVPIIQASCRGRVRHRVVRRWYRATASLSRTEPNVGPADSINKGLVLSDSCVKQLQAVTKEDPAALLRVVVDGGGCSGFQYKFSLDNKPNPDDKLFEREGVRVVIDDLSLSLLKGSTVDFHTELIRSSFRIADNPNAELGCSCGASFALK